MMTMTTTTTMTTMGGGAGQQHKHGAIVGEQEEIEVGEEKGEGGRVCEVLEQEE